jgi:hypothetical protein
MQKIFFSIFLIINTIFSQGNTLSGIVLDAESMLPLPSATIRIIGTSKGTVTNAQGQFRFSLPQKTITLAVSYLGYESDTITVELKKTIFREIRLQPNAIQLAGVTVTDEDPAYEIIRRAIENKKKWMARLNTFEGEAFSRTQIRTDSSIAAIIEGYSILYWKRNDSLREVVVQRKQTKNMPRSFLAANVNDVVNFNDDRIKLGGYTFLGPTAPNAFEYYDYKLLSTRQTDEYEIYDIELIPTSAITPFFKGRISIASRSYAVMDVDVQPNEAYSQMFVSAKYARHTQNFRLYEDTYWLPMNYHFEAALNISVMAIEFPTLRIERDVIFYDYKINPEFPDSIVRLNKITIAPSAQTYDSTFWAQQVLPPLTAEQDSAYRTIDSTQTLVKKLAPRGTTYAVLSATSAGPLSVADVWFNRVEGFHLGASGAVDSVYTDDVAVHGGIGYGFADKRWKYDVGAAFHFGATQSVATIGGVGGIMGMRRAFVLSAGIYDTHVPLPYTLFTSFFVNSFETLINKNDVYDYYRTKGGNVSLTYIPVPSTQLTLKGTSEQQLSLYQNTTFAWFGKNRTYRSHPKIADGQCNAVKLSAYYNPVGIVSFAKDALTASASAEYTSPSLESSFDYLQVMIKVRGKISTMKREELFLPPALNLLFSFGTTRGNLPPQRYFTPTTNLMAFVPLGVHHGIEPREIYGDRFATFAVEHNFRRILFAPLGIRWLMESNLELLISATASRYWLSNNALRMPSFSAKETNGWYYETTAGIQNILDVFRVDVTWRLSSPRDVGVSIIASDFLTGFFPEQ